jgi:uncharacterized membrane protein
MSESTDEELRSRISRLEDKVEQLEQKISESTTAASDKSKGGRSAPERSASRNDYQPESSFWDQNSVQFGEQWLNRIGIGLLLIGVAFLFKYSIDQGWLIPQVRSAIGLGVGLALFAGGLRMRAEMSPMKQILLGGGIAVFYITGFATFQLYSFVAPSVVWSFMVIVTLFSLSLSLQQDEAVLSVVGTLGAFGTPFMLYTGGGSIVSLMIYTVLILAGSIVVYMRKGWKLLLWTISLGGAVVIFVGLINTTFYEQTATLKEHWWLQITAVCWMLCGWVLPVVRDMLSSNDLAHWPDPSIALSGKDGQPTGFRSGSSVHLMAFIVPLLMLIMVMGNWDISMNGAGMVAMALAAAGSLLYLPLKNAGLTNLASSHILLGLGMLTIGFILLLEGNFLFVVLAVEAAALRYVSFTTGDTKISGSSHLLFGIVFLWLVNGMSAKLGAATLLVDIDSLTYLGIILLGGAIVPQWLRVSGFKQVYYLSSHLLFLFWMYQNLSALQNGQAWISVAWGIYAIGIIVLGFLRHSKGARLVGMGTIFVVVGKLFLVDLSQLEAIWRILLFMGFGSVFLMLGYYWQSKWDTESAGSDVTND